MNESLLKQEKLNRVKEASQQAEELKEQKIKKNKGKKERVLDEANSVSDQILELIREGSPALVTRMKDIVDII